MCIPEFLHRLLLQVFLSVLLHQVAEHVIVGLSSCLQRSKVIAGFRFERNGRLFHCIELYELDLPIVPVPK